MNYKEAGLRESEYLSLKKRWDASPTNSNCASWA